MLKTLRNLAVVSAVLLFAAPSGDAMASAPPPCTRGDSLEACGGGPGEICRTEEDNCLSAWCDDLGVAIIC